MLQCIAETLAKPQFPPFSSNCYEIFESLTQRGSFFVQNGPLIVIFSKFSEKVPEKGGKCGLANVLAIH